MKSALLAVLFCLPTFAFAQSGGAELRNSGSEFVRICGSWAQGQQSPNGAACGIWLTGVMDGLQAYNSNMKSLPLFDAADLNVGQVSRLLVNYITSHPQQASLPTSALVLGALVEAYPRKEVAAPAKPQKP